MCASCHAAEVERKGAGQLARARSVITIKRMTPRARLRTWIVGAGLAAAALTSRAARADPPVTLAVAVGHTASMDVGFARGLVCDDVSIMRAELRNESPTSNRFYVTGIRPGETLCRVGAFPSSPTTILVHVVVVP